MPAPFGTEILVAVTRGLLASVEGRVDRQELLAAAGVAEHEIADPDAWLEIERHVRLGRAIARALPGRNLGLETGASIFGDPGGALGYTLRRSERNFRALKNFCAYLSVVNRSLYTELELAADSASLTLHMVPELEQLGHPTEALLSAWVAISRHLTAQRWQPTEVSFAHEPKGDTREHEEFFGCPVVFGRAPSRLLLPGSACALPIESSAHELEQTLLLARDHARALASDEAPTSNAISECCVELGSVPLDVSALANDARLPALLALSRGLLLHSRSFVYEVAFLLGFADVRLFEQAYVARFHEPPARARRR